MLNRPEESPRVGKMINLRNLVFLAVLAGGVEQAVARSGIWLEGNESGRVIEVIDGDSFRVRLTGHNRQVIEIRLWGLDCPEVSENRKCLKKGESACKKEVRRGRRVTRKMRNLVQGKAVTLKGPYKNNGNRKLSYMHLKRGNVDVGRRAIEQCLCVPKYRHKRKAEYQKAGRHCR